MKFRHEYKYLIDSMQQKTLQIHAAGVLRPDGHADEAGEYLIRSLYFDGIDDSCFYENEDGYDPREKYRIRFYNFDASYIVLERKAKTRMMTQKSSCRISEEQCRIFMEGKIPEPEGEAAAQQAMFSKMRLQKLRPVVIVQYLRRPYMSMAGNVRVTFDEGIASSNAVSDFLQESIPLRQVLPVGQSILEVKWDEMLPGYIREQMQLDRLQWTSFSKYYLCRKYNCYGGIRT